MMSAPCSLAASRIFCAGTITPEVDHGVVVALQDDPTMFLPMSWTSPFTVAMMILPLALSRRLRLLLGLHQYGSR